MALGIRICRTFLHVARVRKHTDMREWHALQKSVTRIIYLGPLPTPQDDGRLQFCQWCAGRLPSVSKSQNANFLNSIVCLRGNSSARQGYLCFSSGISRIPSILQIIELSSSSLRAVEAKGFPAADIDLIRRLYYESCELTWFFPRIDPIFFRFSRLFDQVFFRGST